MHPQAQMLATLGLVSTAGCFYCIGIMALLEIRDLFKSYPVPGQAPTPILKVDHFQLAAGRAMALAGSSGSGKTTLLHLIAGILAPDSGSIRLDGQELVGLSEAARDRVRALSIGYIFQTFNLLQGFTCLENVLLGMAFGSGANRDRAIQLLTRVGLADRIHHRPSQLSTGQQQRVAVARALANNPKLVLADEPTGNLDATNARNSLELIREAVAESGASLLLVSHDPAILQSFTDVRSLADINLVAR